MERRINSRVPAAIDAEIYQAGKRLGVFAVEDIGVSGLCVANGDGRLCADKFLRVVIRPPRQTGLRECDMSALVIWAENHRAGLMWAGGGAGFTNLFSELSGQAA